MFHQIPNLTVLTYQKSNVDSESITAHNTIHLFCWENWKLVCLRKNLLESIFLLEKYFKRLIVFLMNSIQQNCMVVVLTYQHSNYQKVVQL